jgi:ribosomal-protein-serine acetyltransferase
VSAPKPILIDLPMPITTPRLLIRPVQAGDGEEIHAAVQESLAELDPWMPWARARPGAEDAEENVRRSMAQWILREDLRLSFFERHSGRFLGGTGLHRMRWAVPSFEIGYWVRSSAVGNGFVTEATHALTLYCLRQLKARRVEIHCNARNSRSVRVPERLGFVREGVLRGTDAYAADPAARDLLYFARFDEAGLPPLEVLWPA